MKRFAIAMGLLLLAAVAGGGVYLLAKKTGVGQWKNYGDPATRAVVEYPASSRMQELSEEDLNYKVVFRTASAPDEPELYLISMRYEDGLRAVANATKKPPLDLILANAERALPQRFNEFSKVSENKFELRGRPAAVIIFTYKKPGEETVKQRLQIVVRDDDTAIYLSAQGRERDWQTLELKYFNHLFASLRFD